MPISEDILTLEIEPPYIGSAVSPTVDIDETTDDITVTITDFRGEHSYTVEKTDQAIEDAEQAAQNANDTAQNVAQGWTNKLAEINGTLAQQREQMGSAAHAESQRVTAENLRVNAENERVQEWDELSTDATAAIDAANAATLNATSAANRADDSSRVANEMISRGNTTITNIGNAANQIFGQAGQAIDEANAAAQSANTAATNANTKAGIADTAAQNADTATTAANNAATTATTAAEQADAAREAIQDDLAAKADKDGYYQQLTAGLADTLMSGDAETVQFAQRVSGRDGMVRVESLRGNTVRWNQKASGRSGTVLGLTITHNHDVSSGHVSGTASASDSIWIEKLSFTQGHKYYGKFIRSDNGDYYFTSTNLESNRKSSGESFVYNRTGGNTDSYMLFKIESGTQYDFDYHGVFIDLTEIFGAGNEPATVEEFERMFPESYYPYDAGSLQSVNVEGVEAAGKNLIDCAYDNKSSSAYRYEPVQDGLVLKAGVTYTAKPFGKDAVSNANILGVGLSDPVFHWGFYQVAAKTITPTEDITISKASIAIAANTFGGFTLEVGSQATEYVPYKPSITREIPASTYFPDGLRSAGTAYDELDFVNHKAVTRIGAVDLGTLNWGYDTSNDYFDAVISNFKTNTYPNPSCIKCLPYTTKNVGYASSYLDENLVIWQYNNANTVLIRDSDYDNAASFKAAMNGVMLYYELAAPTETNLPETLQATYPVEQGGTESIVIPTGEQSAPSTMAIVYGYTADGVRDETQSIVASVEHGVASSNYGVGSYLVMGGTLYRVTTAIATGETINPGTNCTATTVMAELIRLTA